MNFINDILGTGDSSARAQNQMNRDFQERMSDTAVQRRSADLKAAGFNPILAVGSASQGASTPTGSAGSASNSNFGSMFGTVAKLIDKQGNFAEKILNSARRIFR